MSEINICWARHRVNTLQSHVGLWLLDFHACNSSILGEQFIDILLLECIRKFLNPKICEWSPLLSFIPLFLSHFLVLSIVESHVQPVRELFHAPVVPSFGAELCCLHTAEIHKCKLLWSRCDWVIKNAATQDEILLDNGAIIFLICLLLLLDSIVPEDQIQFLNNISFSAKWVDQSDVNTCLWIIISVLFMEHHVQFLVPKLQESIENYAVSNQNH